MRKCSDHGPLLKQNVGNKDLKLSKKKKKKVAERVTTPYYMLSDLVNKRETKSGGLMYYSTLPLASNLVTPICNLKYSCLARGRDLVRIST